MKGRKPKDVAMKLLNGNAGHKPLAPIETDQPFTVAEIDKPDDLDEYGSKEWDRLVASLAPILSKFLREHGETYTTQNKDGMQMHRQRPEVSMRANARTAYHRALSELGASPVAHTRVKKLPGAEQQALPGMSRFFTA
jgi:phage terminase small subunit